MGLGVASLKRALRRVIPRQVNSLRLQDALDWLRGRRDPLIPSRSLMQLFDRECFEEIGQAFLQHFIHHGGLQPGERVLDVGCGMGRMALPLTRFLDARGSYEGMDIVPEGIRWCQKRITPRFPRFRFTLADVYNGVYNPTGRYPARGYRFPYADGAFDFVFLTSVFTHMLPPDLENYMEEVARVLPHGGRSLITFFLLNPESQELLAAGRARFPFAHDRGRYRLDDANYLEAAVAYEEDYVREQLARVGLEVRPPIHYGSWCGRANYLDFQDIVIAVKAR